MPLGRSLLRGALVRYVRSSEPVGNGGTQHRYEIKTYRRNSTGPKQKGNWLVPFQLPEIVGSNMWTLVKS